LKPEPTLIRAPPLRWAVCARAVIGRSREAKARTSRLKSARFDRKEDPERAANDMIETSYPMVVSIGKPLGKGKSPGGRQTIASTQKRLLTM
jgi:hypothetical protein